MGKAKPFDIPKRVVWEAYQRVRANRGAAGVDDQSIEAFDRDVKNNLVTETAGAISYYFSKHNLKLQGDISDIHDQAAGAFKDDMLYRVQAQIIF